MRGLGSGIQRLQLPCKRNTTFIVSGEKWVKTGKDSKCMDKEWDEEAGTEVSGC